MITKFKNFHTSNVYKNRITGNIFSAVSREPKNEFNQINIIIRGNWDWAQKLKKKEYIPKWVGTLPFARSLVTDTLTDRKHHITIKTSTFSCLI